MPEDPTGPASDRDAVAIVDPTREPGWDATVAALGGSVFHTAAWARILSLSYGFTPLYHVLRTDEGQVRGVLPLMEINSWITGRRGVSLPFTDACDTLGDAAAGERLHRAAVATGTARRWKYLECRGDSSRSDAPASMQFHGHRLELALPADELFRRLEPSCQRAIRKAQRLGVTIEESHAPEAMRSFYALLCRTRKRHGQPPQPWSFFARLHTEIVLQERGCVMLARSGGAVVAGAVFLHAGSTVLYKYGASDDRFQSARANNLVMWEAIQRHSARGFAILDLGRTSRHQDGLRRFKLSWGAQESDVRYTKFSFRRGRFVSDTDRSSGWHTPLFRRLPTALSRAAGALLYRHAA